MKIAFWSNASDQYSISANLAAISVTCVIRYPYSVIAFENKRNDNNLGEAFFGRSQQNFLHEVGTNYYDGGGMEGLVRKIYRCDDCNSYLDGYVMNIIPDHLFYIPHSKNIHNEIFEYEFNHCIHNLLGMVDNFADICMIETASHQNLSTKTILEESDLIVVNLCQKQCILEDFFQNYSSLVKKSIFIISNYDFHNKFSCKRISNLFDITLENLLPIPYSEAYLEAFLNGNVKPFIYNNYQCLKENPNYMFMQAVKKATYMIIKKAAESKKNQENTLCCR